MGLYPIFPNGNLHTGIQVSCISFDTGTDTRRSTRSDTGTDTGSDLRTDTRSDTLLINSINNNKRHKQTTLIFLNERRKKSTEPIRTMWSTTRTIRTPYEEIADLKNGVFQFNFPTCRQWLEGQGRKSYGNHFRIYPEDHDLLLTSIYAIGDKRSSRKKKPGPQKGILLNGPIGCGKPR